MVKLKGVDTHICDPIIRIELAKAGITAFRGKVRRQCEVLATVIGIINYGGGVQVTFRRGWFHYGVELNSALPFEPAKQLNDQWGSQVHIAQSSHSSESISHGVCTYHVDTQDGLSALVAVLNATFGDPVEVNPQNIATPDFLKPWSFIRLPDLPAEWCSAEVDTQLWMCIWEHALPEPQEGTG